MKKKSKNKLPRKISVTSCIGLLIICGLGCSKSAKIKENVIHPENTIMVYSAAGLTNVINEIADSFETNYKIHIKTNLASSGTLARQIEQGERPDVYISASKRWIDYIDSLGYIIPGSKSAISRTELVLIAPIESSIELVDIDSSTNIISLLESGRLSIGDPSHVPAGKYAKESLEYYGWFKKLENKLLPAKGVRSALMVVEMEEAPLGIVYRTDALKSEKVKILGTFPGKSHTPIQFIAGLCKDNQEAKDFYAYLNSEASKAIWLKHGFIK